MTIIGHIMLYRSMNKRGRDSLAGTPFADEVERGFSLSQVASHLVSGARHLISFGTKGGRRKSVTESDFTDSNGFTASNFAIVNNNGTSSTNGKGGPILPVVAPQPPIDLPPPASTSTAANDVSAIVSNARPTSPFSRANPFRAAPIAGHSHKGSKSAGGISVVTNTHTYEDDSSDSVELSEIVEVRPKGPYYRDPATGALERADINVSDAIAEEGSAAASSAAGVRGATKAEQDSHAPTTWVLGPGMDKWITVPAPSH